MTWGWDRRSCARRRSASFRTSAWVERLYDALRANLVATAGQLSEGALFVGPAAAQVGPGLIDLDGVATIHDLASALRAIDTIVEQGEGSPADRADSHYQRFQAIRQEYRSLLAGNPAFDPAWPVVDSPVMRRPPDPTGKTFIDHPVAAQVLDLANAVYAMLLQLVVQSFGRVGANAQDGQGRALSAAIGLMHVLSRVAGALVRQPASLADSRLNAGMSFTGVRSIEPIFTGTVEEQLILERLAELVQGARAAVRADPSLLGVAEAIEHVAVEYRAPPPAHGFEEALTDG